MSNIDSNPAGFTDPSGDADFGAITPPVIAPVAQDPSAERNKRIFLAFLTSLLIRPLSLIIPIVTVPLFLKYLGGDEGFGLYELVGSVALYLGMTNVGMTMGLVNKLTDCHVSGDRELARRYVSTLIVAMTIIGLITAVLFSIVVPMLNLRHLFHVQGDYSNAALSWALWTGGIVTLLNLIAALPHSIYFAEQQIHRSNIWDGISKVLTLAACVLIVKTRLGIAGVLLAVSGTPVFVRLINAIDMFVREKRWLMPLPRLFAWPLLWAMLSEGVLIFVLQLAGVLLFYFDKIVIGVGVDPAAVAGYAIVGRIFVAGYGVFMAVLTPMWPASGEAVRRGDIRWVKRSLRYSLLLGCGMSILVGFILYFWHDPVLRLYLRGQPVNVTGNIILALTATFVVRAWIDCRSITLNSTGVLVPQIFFYAGHALLNVIVAIAVVKPFGVAGVAWSTPITAIFTSAWGYPWMMRKYIFSREPLKPEAI